VPDNCSGNVLNWVAFNIRPRSPINFKSKLCCLKLNSQISLGAFLVNRVTAAKQLTNLFEMRVSSYISRKIPTHQNSRHYEFKSRLQCATGCCLSVQNLLFSGVLSTATRRLKQKTITLPWMSQMVHRVKVRAQVEGVQETGCWWDRKGDAKWRGRKLQNEGPPVFLS
jgi:hypothetical protein